MTLPRAFRLWRAILLVLAFALGGFLLYAGLRVVEFGRTASRLPQERAAARREGIPLTPADLRRRRPPVPAEQNAAPLYRRIAAALDRQAMNADAKTLDWLRRPKARTNQDREAARRVLARRKPVLDLAERAAALPGCDFRRPYEKGAAIEFPEYAALRHVARLLAARATLESDAGQPEKAFASVAVGARIADHVGEDTGLIALLVQIAIRALMDRAFHTVLNTHQNTAGVVTLARRTEAAFGARPDFLHALGGEVVLGTVTCQQMRAGRLDDAGGVPRKAPAWVVNGWEANMLSLWREAFAKLRAAGDDPLAQYQVMRGTEQHFDDRARRVMNVLAAILFPVFDTAALKVAQEDALRQLRKTAVALVAYRQKTGRYPERLNQLPAPAPPDPFTGKPFVYRRAVGGGFVLYSVGMNLKDDGGRARQTRPGGPDDTDLVVNYAG